MRSSRWRRRSCSHRAGSSRVRSASELLRQHRLVAGARLRGARRHVRVRQHAHDDDRPADRGEVVAVAIRFTRGWPAGVSVPSRAWAFGWGGLVGILLWWVAPTVQGDGLFHLARTESCSSSTTSRSIGSRSSRTEACIRATRSRCGTASSRSSRGSPERPRAGRRAPAVRSRADRRRRRLRGRVGALPEVVGGRIRVGCAGGAHLLRARTGGPTSSSAPRRRRGTSSSPPPSPSRSRPCAHPLTRAVASVAAAGLVIAVVHLHLRPLPLDPVRRIPRRTGALGARRRPRGGLARALVAPAALFMLWLLPVVRDTRSVTPDAGGAAVCLRAVRRQVDVRSDTVYSLAAEVSRAADGWRSPAADPAGRPRCAAALVRVRRRRISAVFARLLAVPLRDARRSRLDLAGAAGRRLPSVRGRSPAGSASSPSSWGDCCCRSRSLRDALQFAYPGDFEYVLEERRLPGSRGSRSSEQSLRSSWGSSGAGRRSKRRPGSRRCCSSSLWSPWASGTGIGGPLRRSPRSRTGSSAPSARASRRGRSCTRIRRRATVWPRSRRSTSPSLRRGSRRHGGEPPVRARGRCAKVRANRRSRHPRRVRSAVPRGRPRSARPRHRPAGGLRGRALHPLSASARVGSVPATLGRDAAARHHPASRCGGGRPRRRRPSRTPGSSSPFRSLRPGRPSAPPPSREGPTRAAG